jgi:peptidyl-prolyl cis-trans isomerase SurA
VTTDWVIKGSHRKTLALLGRAVLLGSALMMAATTPPALAREAASSSPFAPVLTINDTVITGFELDQRMRFLMLLRAPGDPEEEALKALTQDRLAASEARRLGLRLTGEQITQGMAEFAGRANLSPEEFVAALAQGGVAVETFRDFVANGLLWRELVRGKYAATVSVSEADVDRSIANGNFRAQMQLLLSELVIPVEGDPADELALARRLQSEITSEDGFAAAARRYSASPSAGRGGRLDWTPAANLPATLVGLVLALSPGQVSAPVTLPNAVALFQLRDMREDTTSQSPVVEVEYAEFLMPNTGTVLADAAALTARIDTCTDLFAEARGLPEDRLSVSTRLMSEVPSDVGLQLAQLDRGEASTAIVRGDWRVYLMLCARNPKGEGPIDRVAIRNSLTAQKLTLSSELYLEELRSEAIIKTP